MPNNFLSAELMASIFKALTDHIDLQNELLDLLEGDNEELKTKLVNAELRIEILQLVQPPAPWTEPPKPPPAPRHTAFVPAEQGEQQAPQSEPPRHQGRPRPGF